MSRTKCFNLNVKEWIVLERKERCLDQLCFANLLLLNVLKEFITMSLWKKLVYLRYPKSLVNKLFYKKVVLVGNG